MNVPLSRVLNPTVICHQVHFQTSATCKAKRHIYMWERLKRPSPGSRASGGAPRPLPHAIHGPPTAAANCSTDHRAGGQWTSTGQDSSSAQQCASSGEPVFFIPWGHDVPRGQRDRSSPKNSWVTAQPVCMG